MGHPMVPAASPAPVHPSLEMPLSQRAEEQQEGAELRDVQIGCLQKQVLKKLSLG